MCQSEWVLCDCEECYFCLNGHTTGIAHKQKKRKVVTEYKCGTRVTSKKCLDKRFDLKKGLCYCRMCYSKQDDSLTSKTKKKNATTPP